MGKLEEKRNVLLRDMYTAISKATAETLNEKGEPVKVTYNGYIRDLFSGLNCNSKLLAAFMYVMTHKTDALPTTLFRLVPHGNKPVELTRVNSGFYDRARKHITGVNLIPFIAAAMKEYIPTPREKRQPISCESESAAAIDFRSLSDDELNRLNELLHQEMKYRLEVQAKKEKLQQVLELAEMTREELLDLLS